MIAAEAAFFDGNHCQHVADRDEHRRQDRKRQEMRQVLRLRERSPLRSTKPQADAGHLALFIAGNEPSLF